MRKQLLGTTSVGFGLLFGGAVLALSPDAALAACAGTFTNGADTVNCSGTTDGVDLNTLGDEDTINFATGSIFGNGGDSTLSGGADNDSFLVRPDSDLGFAAGGSGTLLGAGGQDTIIIRDSSVGRAGAGLVSGGGGDDLIRLRDGSFLGEFATGSGTLQGNDGEDNIRINASTVGNNGIGLVQGGNDNDLIVFQEGSIIGNNATGSGTVEGNGGADTIRFVESAQIGRAGTAQVHGGGGNDFILISDSTVGVNMTGNGTVEGGTGEDSFLLDAAIFGRAGSGILRGDEDNDTITIQNGSILGEFATGSGTVSGSDGDDILTVNGSTLGQAGVSILRGGNDNDTINVVNNSIVGEFGTGSGSIHGNSGEDEINFNGSILGRAGSGQIRGGDDNDTINVLNGSILGETATGTGTVEGNNGDDLLAFDSAIIGGAGSGEVRGGDDNDIIRIENGSIVGQTAGGSGTIEGNGGEDTITLLDSTLGGDGTATIDGGAGSDEITLAGTSSLNATSMVLAGGSADRVILFDTVTAAPGATIDGQGNDMDNFVLDGSGTGLFDGSINLLNFEMLTKQGTGTWTWTQDAAFVNGATIDNGFFELNAMLTADTLVNPMGTLGGIGEVIGNVDNDGAVAPATVGTIGTLTVTGDYDGGGVLMLDTVLGASGSPSDLLVITGTVSDVTMVQVTDFGGGTPQLTGTDPGDGILVVDVSAGSTNADDFVLQDGPIDVGFFSYDLSLESDNNWYLQSTLSAAGLQAGEALAGMLSAAQDQVRSDIGIAHNRIQTLRLYEGGSAAQMAQAGDTQLASLLAGSDSGGGRAQGHGLGVWIEGFGRDAELDPKGVEEFDQTTWGGQFGVDGEVAENFYLGLVAGYANSDLDFDGADGDIESYTLGAYAAYIDGGFYIDGVIKGGWLDFENSSGGASQDYDGWLAAGAVKTGYGIALGEHVSIEPNAGLTWVHVDHEDFTFGTVSVDEDSEDSLQGRLGLRLSGDWETGGGGRFSPYIEAGVNHEFMGENEIEFSTVNFESDMGGTSFDVGGGIAAVFEGGLAVSAGVTYTGGEHIDAIQGNLGIGVRF